MKKPVYANSLSQIITSLAISVLLSNPAIAVPSSTSAAAKTSTPVAKTGTDTTSKTSSQKLQRSDFRVTGASCVACLRRIGKTMREQKGVLKADVSIFKPYWAIVIFDSAQTNMDKVAESVKNEKVKFDDMEVKAIDTVPLIVIPKGISRAQEGYLPDTAPSAAHSH